LSKKVKIVVPYNVTLKKNIFLRFVNRCSMSNYPYMFNTRAVGYALRIFRPHGVCALCSVHFHPFSSQYVFSVVLFIPVKDHLRKIASRQFVMCNISMHLHVHTFFLKFWFLSLKIYTPVLKF
jgi:hypothetical protein